MGMCLEEFGRISIEVRRESFIVLVSPSPPPHPKFALSDLDDLIKALEDARDYLKERPKAMTRYNMPVLHRTTLKRFVGFKDHADLPPSHHEWMGPNPGDIYRTVDVQVELLSCGHWIEQPSELADGRDCPRCRERHR